MHAIRTYVIILLLGVALPFLLVVLLVDGRPVDEECLRVIARMHAAPDWQQQAHARPHESVVCRAAEQLQKERQHGH